MASETVIVSKSPTTSNNPSPRFDKDQFSDAIWKMGYDIIHEKCLQCPCKSRGSNQLSNCKNCGGTGFIFINPVKTKMILTAINYDKRYKEWSEENLGNVNVTAMDREKLSFMDRLTVSDGEAYFSEVLHINKSTSDLLFAYTSYNIKNIEYAGLFINTDEKLQRLVKDTDYTFDDNRFYLDEKYIDEFDNAGDANDELSITVRYKHAPQFYVVSLSREVINTNILVKGKETSVSMPVAAIARRSHYVLDGENISNTRILDNSFIEEPCYVDTKDRDC